MNPILSYANHDWHSPLASSLPYISSVDSSFSERGMIVSMGKSPLPYDHDDINELQYHLDEEIASSSEHIHVDGSSDDGSDHEIDEIRRAIDKTLGSSEKDEEDETPRNINPRAKYLAQLGIGKKSQPVVPPITQKLPSPSSSRTTPRSTTPRTPPTTPVSGNDDSLDAMLALMGISDDITTPHVIRSSPIDIPRRVSRPIPISTGRSRPAPHPRPIMPIISQQQHKYDSDDDTESYFDSPQSEDLSGSMVFDY